MHPPDNAFNNGTEIYSLLKALSGESILVWVMLITEGINRGMYVDISYTHC
jgi:hypothetical protein